MTIEEKSELGKSISGEFFTEGQANELLSRTISREKEAINSVAIAFHKPWKNYPSTNIRAVLGMWVVTAWRHLRAIVTLADSKDLIKVADIHYRQILEILLQIRKFTQTNKSEMERLATKILAWGRVDYLEKTKLVKEMNFAKSGINEIEKFLENFDPELILEIKGEIAKGKMNWFGRSFSRLAKSVSKGSEDLSLVYKLMSAETHGTWHATFNVANEKPGQFDFSGYPNNAQLIYWGASLIDRSVDLYVVLWNEVARRMGAPEVNLIHETEDLFIVTI